jgi:16S rRNA (guanine527-N7)-methyltransferase
VTSRVFRERLLSLAESGRIGVPEAIVEPLHDYFELLAQWNSKINLTSLPLRPPSDEALWRLLLEPLAAAAHIPDAQQTWFDIGSGGGSPAIPLRLVRPALDLRMVESTARKAAFLRETVRKLRLTGTIVFSERAEDLTPRPDMRHVADLITMRAVRLDADLLRSARQLIAEKGRLLVFCSTLPAESAPWFSHQETIVLGASPRVLLACYTPVFHVEQSS